MKFMETFQWNHVNVFAVSNTLAETDRELFLNMASSYDMCAFSFSIFSVPDEGYFRR